METKPTVACIIPAYNEEAFIADVICTVPDVVDRIFVVDDASQDHTARVVTELNDPRVTLLQHEQNQGVGAAMVTGYRAALETDIDVVVKMDADGQMDPQHIERLIAPILEGSADYCKGVRFRDREVLRQMPKARLVGNLGLSFLTKLASGYWNIFDPTNGYTAIGRAALELLNFNRLRRGFFFETDMLINLYLIEAVVMDIPMKARYGQETSHLSSVKMLLTFPMGLARGLLRRLIWRYFILDFSAVSAFLVTGSVFFLAGSVFGLWKWITIGIIEGRPTPPGTVMLAAVPVILGFQLLLQAIVLDIQNVPRRPLQKVRPE